MNPSGHHGVGCITTVLVTLGTLTSRILHSGHGQEPTAFPFLWMKSFQMVAMETGNLVEVGLTMCY